MPAPETGATPREPDDSAAALLSLPEVRRLLDFLRSDNPLLALGVTNRELSWSHFLGWLLDPVRDEEVARHFLGALLDEAAASARSLLPDFDSCERSRLEHIASLGRSALESIDGVETEAVRGEAGRTDVEVACTVGGEPVRLIIENKIDASEREGQLAGYVDAHEGDAWPVPIFIDLADEPARRSSCPWALCWARSDVARWLRAGAEATGRSPSMVAHYLSLFEAWDTAHAVRQEHRGTVEAVADLEDPPAEWALLREWLVARDIPFFQEVLSNPRLREVLRRHGLEREMHGRMKADHDFLKLSKADWTLRPAGPEAKGINVHYECRGRGRVQIDAELYPFEGSVEKNPGRREQLSDQLDVKATLHRNLRQALGDRGDLHGFGLSFKGLRRPNAVDACTVAKFDAGADEDWLPADLAQHLVRVIAQTVSTIDRIVERTRRGLSEE